jgi:glycosyltransferase involved in cell wall biosynthesis
MHILLLNQYFPPDTAATAKMAALVVEALAERHRVTVVAGRPSYDPTERHPWRIWRRDLRGNVLVERVGSTAFPRFRMRGRVSNYLSYLALAMPRALAVKADVVLAMTDPPVVGLLGAAIAKARGVPFVYNIRDLYPDMVLGGGVLRPGQWIEQWEALHRKVLQGAARVIVLGEDARERIVNKGVAPERVVVVRDGAAVSARAASRSDPATQEVRGGYRFVLLHAGNLGFYGAWQTLVEAAEALAEESVGLVFVGEGALKPRVESMVNGRRAVRFLSFRPAEQIPNVMAAGDLHVVTVRRGLEGVVVPSKLYGILAAGRPVLAVAPPESDVTRIVRRYGCGVVADPEDPGSVVEAVRRVRRDPEELERMGERAREAAREFDQTRELQRFVQIMEEVTAE